MERELAVVARTRGGAVARRAVGVCGAVDGVDVPDREAGGGFEDEDPAFGVPGDGADGDDGGKVVFADDGADAIDFFAEACGGGGLAGGLWC